jgi:hypothetical protein
MLLQLLHQRQDKSLVVVLLAVHLKEHYLHPEEIHQEAALLVLHHLQPHIVLFPLAIHWEKFLYQDLL